MYTQECVYVAGITDQYNVGGSRVELSTIALFFLQFIYT